MDFLVRRMRCDFGHGIGVAMVCGCFVAVSMAVAIRHGRVYGICGSCHTLRKMALFLGVLRKISFICAFDEFFTIESIE